jgi:hypothetical protein
LAFGRTEELRHEGLTGIETTALVLGMCAALLAEEPHWWIHVPAASDDDPSNLLESGPLYAGAGVTRISDICPAAELVKRLSP